MNILTVEYVLLVAFSLIGIRFISSGRGKKAFLLIASLFFFAWWDIRFLLPLLLYVFLIYKLALVISETEKGRSKIVTGIGIAMSITVLFYFKYFHFVIGGCLNLLMGSTNIIAPIGLSFLVLSAIGYLLDVYWGKYEANRNCVEVMLFLCYFPKFLSGPIERQDSFASKINAMIPVSKDRLWKGIQIIIFGLIKKVVIADRLSVCVDAVFRCPEIYSSFSIIWAMVSYSVQIYCDFSGYTDIAIGVSYMLGVPLDKNFDLPYIAQNPSEFWHRWHISLSSWFRDYVYIPLGGARKGNVKTYRNILITMLISGIWHGANWTYWIWGIMHGIAQCICRIWKRVTDSYFPNKHNKFRHIIRIFSNLIFICITWTIFRADSVGQFLMICKRVITIQPGVNYFYIWTIPYGAIVATATAYGYKKNAGHGFYPVMEGTDFWHQVLFWVIILLTIGLAYMGNMVFIYNNF